MKSSVTLTEGMAFDVEIAGHRFAIDATSEHGGVGAGPIPKALILSSLAGCGAMDVISLLRKMRQPPTSFVVESEADVVGEGHPKTFGPMGVVFRVEGDVSPKKLWKAVSLSRDRYCGVAAMLRAHAPITYRVVLNGEDVPEPLG
jgi:putative redox protein